MSRQNKQRKQISMRKQITAMHKNGQKGQKTKKLSSVVKGKCIVQKGKRMSLSLSKRPKDIDNG